MLVLGKPLGVGVYSAALKKQCLDDAGYRELIDTTTRLNTVGAALAQLDGVRAMTDLTGFELLGHLLEMCRGSGLRARIEAGDVPLLAQVRALADAGCITGASARNWESCGDAVTLAAEAPATWQALLTDPQTSGGLLVACEPQDVDAVLDSFHAAGCHRAAVIGSPR